MMPAIKYIIELLFVALVVHARDNQLLEVMELMEGDTIQHKFIQEEFVKFRQEMMRGGTGGNITSQIEFRLYTKSHPNISISVQPTAESIAASPFDYRKPTRFMTHGFRSSSDSQTSQDIKNAYLTYQDVNVILVDWKGPAAPINYISVALNTVPVGAYTARLIDALVESGANPKQIHLVGHSLGAHISGFAGKYARSRVGRITGLDPAGPLFESLPLIKDHLSADQADFVDVIHTSAGSLGFRAPLGHIDFYPNGGTAPQPGCENITYLLGAIASMVDSCSHDRSWVFFADSINPREQYIGELEPDVLHKMPDHHHFDIHNLMGEYVDPYGHGIYYVKTNSQAPFALDWYK